MIEEYRKARKIGKRQVSRALAEGRHPFPPALDEQMRGLPFARETSLGRIEIPLDLVAGTRTVGRQNMFSEGFMPLAEEDTEFAAKWSRLYDAQVAEGFREPIVVRECLQRFYVQEGNKRVSVARYVGMPTIMAEVTRSVPVADAGAGLEDELVRYAEFERFYAVAPLYGLFFTHAGDYARLARLMGRDLMEPWPEAEVTRLKSLFWLFRLAFRQRGGGRLACTESDAFLLYLQAYADADAGVPTPAAVTARVRRMWNEFVVASQPDPIAFVSEPAPAKQGVVSKVVSKAWPRSKADRDREPKPDRGAGVGRSSKVGRGAKAVRNAKALTVGFIYDRSPQTSGWVLLHDRGREELEQRMDGSVLTVAYVGCSSETAFLQAVAEAEVDGCSLVITTSPRQMVQARRAAVEHPELGFLNCSVNLSSGVVRCFYARMYEVKFLMGALAASLSESHQLGYLAFSPINGAVAEVNAFALGAALVDPYATVHLKWLSASQDWQEELLGLSVDVVASRDYPDPQKPDEPYGLYAVRDGAVQHVASPEWDWGRYYELMLRAVVAERPRAASAPVKGRAINYWWGMRTGVVRLDLDEGVALGQRHLVEVLTRAMVHGELAPFDTLLFDQDGFAVRAEGAPALTDEQIASMSWLNSNVVGTLPQLEELSAGGRADVEAAGVVADVAADVVANAAADAVANAVSAGDA